MTAARPIQPITCTSSPLELAEAWPVDRPLCMLTSGPGHGGWARWSILTTPASFASCDEKQQWTINGTRRPAHADPLATLDRLLAETRRPPTSLPSDLPFAGGWIGYLSYDLGRTIEPAAQHLGRPMNDRSWPLIEFAHCPWALVFDHDQMRWYEIGAAPFDRTVLLRHMHGSGGFEVGPFASSATPERHRAAVARTIEYIAAGDIFQANMTRRLSAPFAGSTRRFAVQALERSSARYGAYLELTGGRCLLSLSPELFLQVDPDGCRVVTRPIKGTRSSAVDARELMGSTKDAAELHMIVDLMRNDLGRVCDFGSVQVPNGRVIESHATIHHGVGEVTGRLREGVTCGDLLGATFPGGSVTGAPKIRAMQIIDELEQVRRGPYCGAIGFFSDSGAMCLNIAIRTVALTGAWDGHTYDRYGGVMDYGVGGAVVADSDPGDEYRETSDKAEVLRLALRD